jgi:hypothetical protein
MPYLQHETMMGDRRWSVIMLMTPRIGPFAQLKATASSLKRSGTCEMSS